MLIQPTWHFVIMLIISVIILERAFAEKRKNSYLGFSSGIFVTVLWLLFLAVIWVIYGGILLW